MVDGARRDRPVGGGRGAARRSADGDALHGLVVDAGLIGRERNAPHGAEALPRHSHAQPLVVERAANEAHAGGLVNLVLAVWVLEGDGARGEEAAAAALLARVDEAADARHHLAVSRLLRVDAARAVDARLGGLQLGRVEGGVLEPVDCGHGVRGVLFIL